MFFVCVFRSSGACQSPPERAVSGIRSLIFAHSATQALQPMHFVAS